MATGTGIRLNGALSILLVLLLVLGGMASMSSLEMADTSATEGSGDDADDDKKQTTDTADLTEKERWLQRCKSISSDMPVRVSVDDVPMPLRDRDTASGRQSDHASNGSNSSNNTDDSNETAEEETDWHLPDYITVFETAYGEYVIRIVHDDGTVTEEVLSAEDFTDFLSDHGWASDEEEESEQHDYVDDHNHGSDATDEAEHDWVDEEEEEAPEMHIEFRDDGTIIIIRESGDEVEYEIIRTNDDGKTTIIRVTPWGTEVVHPQPPRAHRQGQDRTDRGDWDRDGMAPLFSLNGEISEEALLRCRTLVAGEHPTISVNIAHPDRPPAEREYQGHD